MIDDYIIISCPHCNHSILIYKQEINCRIFRHAVYKHNFQQIHPHSPKDVCDNLVKNNAIYGCGKPFRITNVDDKWIIEICDYI